MKLSTIVMIGAITFLLPSCILTGSSVEPSSIPTPNIYVETEIGKYLEVTAPNYWNSFKTNEAITLDIQNISDKPITYDSDFDARIFVLTDDKWIEAKNKLIYENDQFILASSEGSVLEKFATIYVQPELLDYSVISYIRIYVAGNLIENEIETKKVASYIDIQLKP